MITRGTLRDTIMKFGKSPDEKCAIVPIYLCLSYGSLGCDHSRFPQRDHKMARLRALLKQAQTIVLEVLRLRSFQLGRS